MISKLKLGFYGLLWLGLSLPLMGCTEFLKGKPKKNDTVVVSKESVNCLKDVSLQVKSFFKTELSSKEIDQSFTCLDQTLNEFQNRVEGRSDPHSFTSDDLFEISKNFMPNAGLTADSTQDLMLLKAAVLGGSNQRMTKKEIGDLRTFFVTLKPEIIALVPYAKVFTFKKGESLFSKSLIRDAFAQLNISLKNLLKATNIARSDYQFEDLKRLVANLSILEPEQAYLVETATKVKNVLVGNYILQTPTDYFLFVDNLTEVLRLYATQVQGTVRFEISTASQMSEAIDYIQSWLSLLEKSVQFKVKQSISLETIDPLVAEVAKLNILPVQLSAATLVNFYKIVVMRVFDSGKDGDVNKLNGLTAQHFINIKREIAIYRIYMNFIEQVVPNEARLPIPQIQMKLKEFDPKSQNYILNSFDKFEQAKILNAFDELRSEFLGSRPVVYRFKKMVIASNQVIWDQNWEDLARAFYAKMLARELLIGWGVSTATNENPSGYASKQLAQSHLNEDGLIQWYAESKDFGIESKVFDKRTANAGSESFKQADLLTFSANGDSQMGFLESIQFVNMLVSGGGETLSEIRIGLGRAKCNLIEKDVFDYPWNNETCAVIELKKNFKYYFSNLPYLNAYIEKLNDQQFASFYYELMEVTRVDAKYRGSQVETADLRAMSIILHYIESIYSMYDKDNSLTFSASEIREAYSTRFKSFAQAYAHNNAKAEIDDFNGTLGRIAYSCYQEEDLVRESFIFLIFTGQTPSRNNLSNLPCFWGREQPLIDFSTMQEVDRKIIISTFKILKAVLGSKK